MLNGALTRKLLSRLWRKCQPARECLRRGYLVPGERHGVGGEWLRVRGGMKKVLVVAVLGIALVWGVVSQGR